MEHLTFLIPIFLVLTFLHIFQKVKNTLPPGPKQLPIIGNLLQVGTKPHSSLAKLAQKYGPLMSVKLGRITTIVISSPEVAKELFENHDVPLSSRTVIDAVCALNHSEHSMVFLPMSSPWWQTLRKTTTQHVLSQQNIEASQSVRDRSLHQFIDYVDQCCEKGKAVPVRVAGFTAALNMVSNTVFSMDLSGYDSDNPNGFKELVWAILDDAGKANLSDYFPSIKFLDLQGVLRRSNVNMGALAALVDEIVKQRRELRASSADFKGDMLDILLDLNEENDSDLSSDLLRHLLLDIFLAGIDTISSSLEWAMTELLRNPKTLAIVQTELREVLDENKTVKESDIPKLPYLQAVIKETFRLHPVVPLLVPRKADIDVELCGYTVPKDAEVFVNVWAIGRNSSEWSNPTSFMPERFLESEIDMKGKCYELIPFGSGKRICPGRPLAHPILQAVLGSLLKSFNWEISDGIKTEDIDITEKFRFTLQKAKSLMAIPTKV